MPRNRTAVDPIQVDLATFTEIGNAIGVSHEQARRIYHQAVKKVRKIAGPIRADEIRDLLRAVDQIGGFDMSYEAERDV
jgi:DNA-directed RNA polymerase sigma subunit (sigma70/sigma32)